MSDETTADTTASPNAEELQARVAKLEEERDNYKHGMLAAKRKLKESGVEDPADDIREIVKQEVSQATAATAAELEKVKREKAELEKALLNNGSMPLAAGGSQPEVVGPQEWTKEQLDYFAKYNIDPKTVKQNIKPI